MLLRAWATTRRTNGTLLRAAQLVVIPAAAPRTRSTASYVFVGDQPGGAAVMDVHAKRAKNAKFMSFMADEEDGNSMELGAIVAARGRGVKFESSQGDFAEWHLRKPGERAFVEGDVVGFGRRGEISRRTSIHMLGVISRKAIVEGSAPALDQRDRYDTVAYMGLVPVKVRRDGGSDGWCR